MTILDILEASALDWKYTPKPDEVRVCCPMCIEQGENPDERYRLGINIRTGKAHCFNCGWRGSDYVFTAYDLARVAEVDMTGDRVTVQRDDPKRPRASHKPVVTWLDVLPKGYEPFNWKSSFERPARNYLQDRGITREQIDRWNIGWAMTGLYAGRVVVPVVMDGRIAGVVGRDYLGTSGLRYKNSEGLRGVFGTKGNKTATMSEGAMDALRIEPVIGNEDSIALFGSNISSDQMDFLRRYERITYLGDNDAPGCKGARFNCQAMSEAGIRVKTYVPAHLDGTDPGKWSNELILKNHRMALSWSRDVEKLLRFREAFG
jgi:DNA primase